MSRTTAELVASIIEVDDSIDLTPFIETATVLVDDNCLDAEYSDERLELIERHLAAHCYACLIDMRIESEGMGPMQTRFQSKVDMGLDLTHYGQMAKRLDRAGGLAAMDAAMKSKAVAGAATTLVKPKIGVVWLGKEPDNYVSDS